jgi:CheY-like chemotaxis protein
MKDRTVGLKVLLVDDEPSILSTLQMILVSEGFDVHTAASGRGAKAALARTSYDVVVTDLGMESKTAGYEVVHAVQALTIKPAMVVMSGFPELLDQWQAEGADAGLQKPTDVPELLATIQRLLANR